MISVSAINNRVTRHRSMFHNVCHIGGFRYLTGRSSGYKMNVILEKRMNPMGKLMISRGLKRPALNTSQLPYGRRSGALVMKVRVTSYGSLSVCMCIFVDADRHTTHFSIAHKYMLSEH